MRPAQTDVATNRPRLLEAVVQLSPGRFLFEAQASADDRTAIRRMPFVVTDGPTAVPE